MYSNNHRNKVQTWEHAINIVHSGLQNMILVVVQNCWQGDHLNAPPLRPRKLLYTFDSKVEREGFTLFSPKLKNMKSDLWKSVAIFQHGGQVQNILWKPLYPMNYGYCTLHTRRDECSITSEMYYNPVTVWGRPFLKMYQ